jgi:polyphosphate kinase
MIFCNDGNEECYISSADLMTRNIEHRIEVTCPVFDKNIRNELKQIFEIQWSDNVKARKLDPALSNKFVKPSKKNIRSQEEVYNFLQKASTKSSEK